jgi:hypothetical protein
VPGAAPAPAPGVGGRGGGGPTAASQPTSARRRGPQREGRAAPRASVAVQLEQELKQRIWG